MRELHATIREWIDDGETVALATVVKTWGSSPRAAGSLMAVDERGRICGSVSGGCIESSVVSAALDCLDDRTARLEAFHAETARAQEVGLSCGGSVSVLVSPLDAALFSAEEALIARGMSYVRASISEGDAHRRLGQTFLIVETPFAEVTAECEGVSRIEANGYTCIAPTCYFDESDRFVHAVLKAYEPASGQVVSVARFDGAEVFFSRQDPALQLICIGGTHVAVHLCCMAKVLGYRTVVVDPRGAFATEERFAMADELLREWPQEAFSHLSLTSATAVCALTHDPKIDVPALGIALESPAFYIGSLGRYTTQLARYRALADNGYADEQIARIYGPIGLDIGGKEPAEIALSVLAEVVAAKNESIIESATMLESAQRALVEEDRRESGTGKMSV